MKFRPASRTHAKPLIGIYSESGCGKSYSALLLARGFVGPVGKIGMIETESGRGEAYSDPAEYPEIGGYEVLPLREDFSPKTYGEALSVAEAAKLDALIIDSASHEWEGVGGVLDMAARNQAAGKKGPLVWQQPKIDHQRFFMLRFMQTSIPLVILCMRAKYPMKEVPKRSGGGKEWIRSDVLEPKQSDDILYEMFVHGWVDAGHRFHMTKCTSKSLEQVFGKVEPITIETGRQLAAWARGGQKNHAAAQELPPEAPAAAPPASTAEERPAPQRGQDAAEAQPEPHPETGSPPSSSDPESGPEPPRRLTVDKDELWQEGQTQAAWGTDDLRKWWMETLTGSQRDVLDPHGRGCPDELKQIAADAERAAAAG